MQSAIQNVNKTIHNATQALIITGAINWGLIGLLEVDLVQLLFQEPTFIRIVYSMVGIAAVWQLFRLATVSRPQA